MVNKKVKSKRISTAQRAKVQRKVREAHRKQAKSHPGLRKKMKKDPGIPANLPFKDKVLRDAELAKEKIRVGKEMQRLQRKTATDKESANSESGNMSDAEAHVVSSEQQKLTAMAQSAASRGHAFASREDSADAADIGFYQLPDHSRKSYFKEFKKVVELSDVILEVLDARDPLGSRVRDIERLILESGTSKRLILILNKIDLVPKENALAWIKYLRNEFPTIAFKCCTSLHQRQKRTAPAAAPTSAHDATAFSVLDVLRPSESFGAESLVQLLKNYCRNANIKTSITVGVVGFPNVGKSSLINSLKRTRVCPTGSTPGLTKAAQEIYLDSNIKLLDSPGVVFTAGARASEESHADLLLRNCLRVEQLEDPILPVELIVAKCPKTQLMLIYHLGEFEDHGEFLIMLAKKLGKLKKGGIADLESTARIVVSDWNSGKIPFCTVPPSRAHEQLGSQLVSQWSSEFSLDAYQPDTMMDLEGEAATDFIQLASHAG